MSAFRCGEYNIECADEGTIVVEGAPDCSIALYSMEVSEKGETLGFSVLAGKTADGVVLSDEQCRGLLALPVLDFSEIGRTAAAWLKSSTGRGIPHELDALVDPTVFKDRAMLQINDSRREEIAAITERTQREKSLLNREVESLKNELRQIENALSRTASTADRVNAEKRRATASKSLKKQEQSLFMDGLKIDAAAEVAIQAMKDNANMTVKMTRLFAIEVEGSK